MARLILTNKQLIQLLYLQLLLLRHLKIYIIVLVALKAASAAPQVYLAQVTHNPAQVSRVKVSQVSQNPAQVIHNPVAQNPVAQVVKKLELAITFTQERN